MTLRKKRPGNALRRTAGAEREILENGVSLAEPYASSCDLQARHVRNRCGVSGRTGRLIAGLCFGQGKR